MANDLSKSLALAVSGAGFSTALKATAPGMNVNEVAQLLKLSGTDKSILLVIREWKSDTMVGSWVRVDATMSVFDRAGRKIGENHLKDEIPLQGSFVNPTGEAEREVPKIFEQKLSDLLNSTSISSALVR